MRPPTDHPNLILINCDDLGYGDLGCYGSALHATPALDRMAAEGILCTDFYMGAPLCSPSRAAMLTGCYPRRVGLGLGNTPRGIGVLFPGDAVGLNPREITIATVLRARGYATMLVGKWHVGDQQPFLPTRHGFDSFFGLPYSNDMGPNTGWPSYPPLPLMRDEEVVQEQPDQASLTERYVERAAAFMRANRARPFFLYFAHMYVHAPLYVPARFLRASRNGPYGGAVECIDWSTAALLHELKRLDLECNTLVIFTSDNGAAKKWGGSNAPLRGHKGTTWEGGLRLPCLLRWPGVIAPGRRCAELLTAMDFLPTLARLAGTAPPGDRIIDGRDCRPLLFGETGAASPHDAFYFYRRDDLEAVRSGPWKLHVKSGELYNLHADVGEEHNVASRNAEVVRRLQVLANRARRDLGDAACGAPGEGCRPAGRVENPQPLTRFDPDNPYFVAMYDIEGSAERQGIGGRG